MYCPPFFNWNNWNWNAMGLVDTHAFPTKENQLSW